MYRTTFFFLSSFLLVSCVAEVQQNETAKKPSNESWTLPYYNGPDFTPYFLSDSKQIEKKITHQIPTFSFLNQDSLLITDKNIEGKIHVASFMFTTCGSICPSMIENLKVVSDSLKNDTNVMFLTYSVTPWTDKPHVLRKYKIDKEIQNKNWHFLTGKQSEIYSLARTGYFAEEDFGFSKDSTEFLHTEHFILVDNNKRIRGIYNGTLRLEMKSILEDIGALLKEI